jgi:lipoprotein signal peptidase
LNIWAYNKGEGFTAGHNDFITINVIFNLGNGFGSGSGWPQGAVYFLKIFMSLIILALVIFLPSKWYYCFPLSASFVGGMFNVFDKVAHNDCVVDYFELFPQHTWFIFNVPDFFITGGIIFTCGSYLVVFIIQMIKDKKNKHNKK